MAKDMTTETTGNVLRRFFLLGWILPGDFPWFIAINIITKSQRNSNLINVEVSSHQFGQLSELAMSDFNPVKEVLPSRIN